MYVMDRYPVKQPQNIIKVKVKHGTEKKKGPGKNLNEKYIIAFIFVCGSVSCLALFSIHQEKLFS